MLTKYANIESILEVKSSDIRIEASDSALNKFAALNDNISDRDGYLYVRCRAISSRVNKNNDGWPSDQLAQSYRTFEGRPIFVDHNNTDPSRTRGVIVSAKLHVDDEKVSSLDPYYSTAPDNHKPPTWVELLLEIDAKTYPKLAKAIRDGDIDAVSMGANIERSICSVCGNEATVPMQFCSHVKQKGMTFEITADNGEKIRKHAYEDCYGITFFEISAVFDPADVTALISEKTGKTHEGKTSATKTSEYKYVKKRGDKWVIIQKGTGKVLSEHDSEEKAKAAFRAMEMHMHSAISVDELMEPVDTKEPVGERNYEPQADAITAPDKVNTLRPDPKCPICGEDMTPSKADQTIVYCNTCGHVQEPDGLDNPDLGKAKQIDDKEQEISSQQVEVKPIDNIAPVKETISAGVISDMWKTKLVTVSKSKADDILPAHEAAVAESTIEFDGGIHMGTHAAFQQAGITATVQYPNGKTTTIPGNPIMDMMLGIELEEQYGGRGNIPINVESDDLDKALEIIHSGGFGPGGPRGARVAKKPLATKNITPRIPRTDEPTNETVKSDQFTPVTSSTKEADRRHIKRQEQDANGLIRTEEILEELGDGDVPGETAQNTQPASSVDGVEVGDGQAVASTKKGNEPVDVSLRCPKCECELGKDGRCPECGYNMHSASAEEAERKLLAKIALADLAIGLGFINPSEKLSWIGSLEDESEAQIDARKDMLELAKKAGLAKKTVVSGIKRIPRLSHTSSVEAPRGSNADLLSSIPDEAIFGD